MKREQRLFKRYSPECYKLFVSEDNNNWQDTTLLNVSAEGISFLTTNKLDTHVVSINLMLRAVMNEIEYNFVADIVWCKNDSLDVDNSIYGASFRDLPLFEKARLNSVLDKQAI